MMLANDLKKSVLQAAVQGKLVKQLSSEGNAEDLYRDIQTERNRLVNTGKIKKDRCLPEINEGEIPFDIPDTWKWVRLGQIVLFQGGYAFKSTSYVKSSNNQVIRLGNVKNNQLLIHNKEVFVNDETVYSLDDYRIRANDILVSMTGTRRKKDYFFSLMVKEEDLINRNLYLNQRVGCFRTITGVNVQYLTLVLQNETIKDIIFQKETGSANQGNLGSEDIKEFVYIPLPPLKEQDRIVDKLNALLPEIDAYGEAEKEWESLQKAFPDDIRKSVLQYAMQGKLVEQYPEEGTGEELFEQLTKEKEELVKAGTIKNGKQPSAITDDDIPFDIPESWKWVRFGDIVDFRLGKTPPRVDAKSWGETYRWVSISDMVPDGHVSKTKEGVSETGFKSSFGSVISPKGTLIMSFKLTIGCVSILDIDALHNEAIISIFPIIKTDNIMRDYLFKIMPYVSKYGDSKKAIKGNTLNSTSLSNLMVPLPPLSEQKRIVDKLNAILPLVNDLSEVF